MKHDPIRLLNDRKLSVNFGAVLLHLEPRVDAQPWVAVVCARRGTLLFRGMESQVRKELAQSGIEVRAECRAPAQPPADNFLTPDPGPIVTDNTVSWMEEMIARQRGVYLLVLGSPGKILAPTALALSYRTGSIIVRDNACYVRERVRSYGMPIVFEGALEHMVTLAPEVSNTPAVQSPAA